VGSPAATNTAGQQAPERRSNARERRHERRRLEHAIETTSVERQQARAGGDATVAFRCDVDLLGVVTATQLADNALRKTQTKRGSRCYEPDQIVYDPYMAERADGLFAENRQLGGQR
jgi:hypothetical protein